MKVHEHIPRSQSVPIFNETTRLKRMDSFFRVVPSNPRVKDVDATTPTPNPADNQGIVFQILLIYNIIT